MTSPAIKRVQLTERNRAGQIHKNESYTLPQLEAAIIANSRYFNNPILGAARRRSLREAIDTMARLIDKDKPGRHTKEKAS